MRSILLKLPICVALMIPGCAASTEPQALFPRQQEALYGRVYFLPAGMIDCPRAPESPPYPKTPRTVEDIATWANNLDRALSAAQAARNACAAKLKALSEWIVNR